MALPWGIRGRCTAACPQTAFGTPPSAPHLQPSRVHPAKPPSLFGNSMASPSAATPLLPCGCAAGFELPRSPPPVQLSYIQSKALAKQIGGAVAASTALTGLERMVGRGECAGKQRRRTSKQYAALGRHLHTTPSHQPCSSPLHSRVQHAASPEMQLRAAEQAWQDSLGQQPAALSGVGSIGGGGAFGGTREEQQRAAAAAYRSRAGQAARESGTVAPPPLTPADALRLAKGASILRHAEADLAEASSRGEAGTAAALAAIRSTSPELDAVRAGGQALLAWFAAKGGYGRGGGGGGGVQSCLQGLVCRLL